MEAQLRAETTRIESELARRKLELEQMEVKKQLDMARAKLKAYQVVEDIENEQDPVEDDLSSDTPSIPSSAAGKQSFRIGRNRIKRKTANTEASRRAQVS